MGQTVRWLNRDVVEHTGTSGTPRDADADMLFDSGDLLMNDTFEFTFTATGEVEYFCWPHAAMASMRDARIIVEP